MSRLHLDIQSLRSRIGSLREAFPDVFDDAEWLADVLEGETDMHAIMTRLVAEQQDAKSMVEAIKERQTSLVERRTRYDTKSSKISEIMLVLMQDSGLHNLVLPEATIIVKAGVPSVVITDDKAIPAEFTRTKIEPDKMAIKEALKAGREVPGAQFSNSGPSLQVRTK